MSNVTEAFRWLRGSEKGHKLVLSLSQQQGTLNTRQTTQTLCANSRNIYTLRGDTYSMFSGLPVRVQGLSNMPPLSGRKKKTHLHILLLSKTNTLHFNIWTHPHTNTSNKSKTSSYLTSFAFLIQNKTLIQTRVKTSHIFQIPKVLLKTSDVN